MLNPNTASQIFDTMIFFDLKLQMYTKQDYYHFCKRFL